ncbi:hypothetical protein BDW02DRAFT_572505 [Decorospora gaudefroyi]|uniref:Uncharacterized protein n=1 Tax=Decorospora gaudefroyi TaxID=184978 RepID=A0A6A5K4F9_9PLEO|nr:hypothetical protein BDW02DRAFT_572505 [Decorospora gaudefroyi]
MTTYRHPPQLSIRNEFHHDFEFEPRLLFPELPPELRNDVYAYLSIPQSEYSSKALNTDVPIQLRTFSCKHTTVQLCPVHHGSTGLLALRNYQIQEALEYHSWLLNNALELRIGVYFKGRINTFIQADWDKKMKVHLRKLAKLHPWLRKVAKYDIQILWDATDGALKSKNNKKTAGQVPLNMVKTLTCLVDEDVKRNKGNLQVGLHLDHRFAVENAMSPTKFGLEKFISDQETMLHGFKEFATEIRKAPYLDMLPRSPYPILLRIVPSVSQEEKALLVIEAGTVSWLDWITGQLVAKKTLGTAAEVGRTGSEGSMEADFPIDHLLAECSGRR